MKVIVLPRSWTELVMGLGFGTLNTGLFVMPSLWNPGSTNTGETLVQSGA
jgi:hypothetical protein